MPPRNERVATMVRAELARNITIGNDALLQKARTIDPSVRRLSPRQFHATYRLPALRSVRKAAGPAKPVPAKTGPAKSAVKSAGSAAAKPVATDTPTPVAPQSERAPRPATVVSTPASAPPSTPRVAPDSPATTVAAPVQSTSRALARPHAGEREAVRAILQTVAREALTTEDRVSFVRLLDSLDERAAVILAMFGRS